MLRAALFRREYAQRLVGGAGRIVERLRIFERNLLVVFAMHDQERAAHLLHHAVEPERLELFQRGVEAVDAEDPHDVVAGHRHRRLEARIDALFPGAVVIPDRAPGDAGSETLIQRRAARRVIAAKADGDDTDALYVDVAARFQIIDAGAAGLLVVVTQRHAAEAYRLAGAGAVHHQHRNAALHQIGHAAQKLNLLGDVEAVEEYDARWPRRLRVLCRHKIAGQLVALERHIDDFD